MQLSKIIPARRKTITADWCRLNFMAMSPEFRAIRDRSRHKMQHCHWCQHPFVDGEMMALACFQENGNNVLCRKCAIELLRSDPSGNYIVSVKHTPDTDRYISFWRPDDRGYAYPLSWAGVYSFQAVSQNYLTYNNGFDSFAVGKALVNALGVAPRPGDIDGDAGPVVLNTKENWDILIGCMILPPQTDPAPRYFKESNAKD